ncbi:MAG: hypothetical protein KAV42_09910, partial [Candidatus Krumholzibacteria bacterium]|nr:hypothetical protein [Candidatus Krumholzibacteria bacterium]
STRPSKTLGKRKYIDIRRGDSIDFIEDRLSRLVRQSLEDDLISISRAAEILNIRTGEMGKMVEEWKMFR